MTVVIHTVHVLTINKSSNKCNLSYTIYDTSTPTCFGIEMPSSGSNYNRGISANMPVYVLLLLIRFLILILILINELIPWKVYSKSFQEA